MPVLGQQVRVLLMAGGHGERFWPKSTRALPKQFLRILGDRTLLRMAFERAAKLVEPASIYVVTGADYEGPTRSELPELPPEQAILEPDGRNTAPALGLAALWLKRTGGDPIIVALPSDHQIAREDEFHLALSTAVRAAEAGHVVTVGVKPARPETGYGYIRLGEVLSVHEGAPIHRVTRFTEKPDSTTARAYCDSGEYLWNTGIVVARLSVLRAEIARHLPAVDQVLADIDVNSPTPAVLRSQVQAKFSALPSVSFDYGVLERSDRVVSIPAAFDWDDVGDWAALGRLRPCDERGNAVSGDALLHDCSGLVVDSAGNRLVVAVCVDDLVVVDTADTVLVCRRDRTQEIRRITAPATAALQALAQKRRSPGRRLADGGGRSEGT